MRADRIKGEEFTPSPSGRGDRNICPLSKQLRYTVADAIWAMLLNASLAVRKT